MLSRDDLPDSLEFIRQSDVDGCDSKRLPLQEHMDSLCKLMAEEYELVLVEGATGTGKSRLIPTAMCNCLHGRVLVLTPSTVDTKSLYQSCELPCCYCIGGLREGELNEKCRIVFATVGMVAKWYASYGVEVFRNYAGVFMDEVNEVINDAQYAMLFECARKERHSRITASSQFVIVGASACLGKAFRDKVVGMRVGWETCTQRRFKLERYVIKVATCEAMYEAIVQLAFNLWRRGQTCLVFLPGKREVKDARDKILKLGASEGIDVETEWVVELHADLSREEKDKVIQPASHKRVVVSSSFAETSVTIPDVDHVVSSGLSRMVEQEYDIRVVRDSAASEATEKQREGRAGRVKIGCATRFEIDEGVSRSSYECMSKASLEFVGALEQHHWKIQVENLGVSAAHRRSAVSAKNRLNSLRPLTGELLQIARSVPFDVRDGQAFLRSAQCHICYEVTALLVFKNQCEWSGKRQFSITEIVELVSGSRVHPDKISRLANAQTMFREIVKDKELAASQLTPEQIQERVAVCMLTCRERLVWRGKGTKTCASYMGEELRDFDDEGYFVAILMKRHGDGLRCALRIPCSPEVMRAAGIRQLEKTAIVVSDSTLAEFRLACIMRLRELGYDTKRWICKQGALETQIACEIMTSPHADIAIVCPNGNGLAKQTKLRAHRWIDQCGEEIATALRTRASFGVCFVGNASLSPGVRNPHVYEQLVPKFQRSLEKCGVPVVKWSIGLDVAEDGIHWLNCKSWGSRIQMFGLMKLK